MKAIIGLGNIGSDYERTRHNVGFEFIDILAKMYNLSSFSSKFQGMYAKHEDKIFFKPSTYMNNSGMAAIALIKYFNISVEDVLVIHDELDLPLGRIKYKIGGGHAGHNGLKSMDSHISKEYGRLRIGINGLDRKPSNVANYVLGRFTNSEYKIIEEEMEYHVNNIDILLSRNLDKISKLFL